MRQDPRGHPHDLFYPGLTRGLGWHARESRAGALRRRSACSPARVQHQVPARDAVRDALARIRTQRSRAYASGALHWHAMLHNAHDSLSRLCILSLTSQAAAATTRLSIGISIGHFLDIFSTIFIIVFRKS